MITEGQQAEVVYKKLQGKASTNANRAAHEEPLNSALIITSDNFWFDADLIPATAPVLGDKEYFSHQFANGLSQNILQYYEAQALLPVPGSINAFFATELRDSVPYNFGDGSYLYSLKDNTGNELAFGVNNWVVDNAAGVLTFFDGVPADLHYPLTIAFYKYVGRKSLQNVIQADGSVQMDPGYVPILPQDVLTKSALDSSITSDFNKLKPTPPPDLSATTLQIAGMYTAFQSGTGTVHANCTNLLKPAVRSATAFFNGDVGVLTGYLDSVSVGQRILSTADDTGTYGELVIAGDFDPYAGVEGKQTFYKALNASVTSNINLTVDQHTAKLTHSVTGSTPGFTFHVDDPIDTIVQSVVLVPPTNNTRYVSGVPTLAISDSVSVSFQVKEAVKSHYGANGAVLTSTHFQNVSYPITTVPQSGDTLPFGSTLVVRSGVYTEHAAINIAGLNSTQIAGAGLVTSTNIRIDTVSSEVRVKSGLGETPSIFGSAFDSLHSLVDVTTDEELQLLNGLYGWPTGNYTTNRPTAGPNYSSIPAAGYRWATFQPIALNNANGFILSILGALNWLSNDSKATVGIKIYARVMQDNGTPVTAWIDCNSPYPGVGKPGAVLTRQKDPAMVAGDALTSATTKKVTFGPVVYSGKLYIRIGIQPGNQQFASVSVQVN